MRNWKLTAGVLALAGTLAACDDGFLEGPGLTTDPNQPSEATIDQVFYGSQVRAFTFLSGDLARHAAMWMQQVAGTGRQMQVRDVYSIGEGDLSTVFSNLYSNGGLVDIRGTAALARAANDNTYLGIAHVWEAHTIGMAASIWGDIPYSEAVGDSAKPALDDQAAVYARVQAVLDSAIVELGTGTGTGPGAVDLLYAGDRTKWTQAANTLKARFYMHWVEAQAAGGNSATLANTACGGNCVQKALAAATNGIASTANDMKTRHFASNFEENLWYQFMNVQRVGDLSAGRRLVELLRTRNDPRLAQYFAPMTSGANSGQIVGAAPGGAPASQLSAIRSAQTFQQPLVTYQENQLILAEANYRLGNAGAALTNLNNARNAVPLPALSGLTGAALLEEIMTEKYIAQFQNMDVWNDYKRTCLPALTPPGNATAIIGRPLYGSAERNANPNIPVASAQPARNDNDPAACPRP